MRKAPLSRQDCPTCWILFFWTWWSSDSYDHRGTYPARDWDIGISVDK